MAFAATTKTRVCIALEFPINAPRYVEMVAAALTDAETYGGATAVTLIEDYLDKLEAALTALNTEAGNAGLIQADVLRWSETNKLGGYESEVDRLRGSLLKVLGLDVTLGVGSSGNRVQIGRG